MNISAYDWDPELTKDGKWRIARQGIYFLKLKPVISSPKFLPGIQNCSLLFKGQKVRI